MNNDENKIIEFPQAEPDLETDVDREIAGNISPPEEDESAQEDAEVHLKAKYELTEGQIQELGEEKAKQKQEHLNYLKSLREEVAQARKEREEKLRNATSAERYKLLKQEEREAKKRMQDARTQLKVKRREMEIDFAKDIAKKLFGDNLNPQLIEAIEKADKPRQGKPRRKKK